MKKIFSVWLAVLAGALLLRLMPYQVKGIEVLSQAPTASKGGMRTQTGAATNSIGLKSGKGLKAAGVTKVLPSGNVSNGMKSGTSLPGLTKTKEEVSQVFQVSTDPQDQVRLSISNGIVTIRGSVGSVELERRLIKQYGQISGVREVRNQLTVRSTNHDGEIAAGVREAFSRDPLTHVGGIAVTVCDGIVFLSGAVSSEEESTHAEEVAGGLRGVKRVSNGLRFPTAGRRLPTRLTSGTRSYPRTR